MSAEERDHSRAWQRTPSPSMGELLASCAAAHAVSTPPPHAEEGAGQSETAPGPDVTASATIPELPEFPEVAEMPDASDNPEPSTRDRHRTRTQRDAA